MEKVIRDGLVAVVYSPRHGAGWSTWSTRENDHMIFDPETVAWIEAGKPKGSEPDWQTKFGDQYYGGAEDLEVAWLPQGTKFVIEEYDGWETVRTVNDFWWKQA